MYGENGPDVGAASDGTFRIQVFMYPFSFARSCIVFNYDIILYLKRGSNSIQEKSFSLVAIDYCTQPRISYNPIL